MASHTVIPFRLTKAKALARVRTIASTPANVAITRHAEKRMSERGISEEQVHRCLRKGALAEAPVMDELNQWKLVLDHYTAGNHLSCIAAVDATKPCAIVITAFWVS
jgi:invasion protein IalB